MAANCESQYPDIIVLGSTGSVGTQALDVAAAHGIRVRGISARSNVSLVEKQARRFLPDYVVLTDEEAARDAKIRLADTGVRVLSGFDGIDSVIESVTTDNPHGITVENSILGFAGLRPTLTTLRVGHRLALANKESLVVGGEQVTELTKKLNREILPVDSEHCAIFQCLRAGHHDEIRNLLLTASGGPFFGYTREMLEGVTLSRTLAHPTWKMGAKITVDSATLMNKGFEVIEAVHLFGVPRDRVRVVVHRESIVHSMVEYRDGSVIAQLSVPDMRHCVQYALTHPYRLEAGDCIKPLDLIAASPLTFKEPDTRAFPLLALAGDCIDRGGALPCVLNAADEVIVGAFLNEKINFCQIPDLVGRVVDDMSFAADLHGYENLISADAEARRRAEAYVVGL